MIRDLTCIALGIGIGAILGNIDRLTRARWRHLDPRRIKLQGLNWRDLLVVLSSLLTLAMGLSMLHVSKQSKDNARQAVIQAEQTRQLVAQTQLLTAKVEACTKAFQTVSVLQYQLGLATDEFTLDVSDAALSYQDTIAAPPPDIARLPVDDPRRQAWFHGASIDYHRIVAPINAQRHEAIDGRKARPYPQPGCGR